MSQTRSSVPPVMSDSRNRHAGLELWGALRALLAVGALVWVAVAWRRKP
jgi:hypothetical protein